MGLKKSAFHTSCLIDRCFPIRYTPRHIEQIAGGEADMAELKTTEKLAIDGGPPIREAPLPREFPGTHYFGDEELELVSRVIKARNPFRFYGPDLQHMCDRLEEAFSERYGVPYALAVSSGSEALYVALAAMGVGPGNEVLIPAYLWTSCINAVVRLGAIPRLVDIDETFSMAPEDLERKISPRTKVIVLVHMSGAPGDIDAVMEIARRAGVMVLEDCAQSNGASYRGRPIGTFGDLGIFSFQINKNITAGEGGMIICSDDHLYKRCFAAHDLGYARNDKYNLMDVIDDPRYQIWGAGARMSELTGALALAQLGKIDAVTRAMREAKWKIRSELAGVSGLGFRRIIDPEGDSGCFLIPIFPSPEICRRFIDALRAEGIKAQGSRQLCLTMEEWNLHWAFNNPSLVHKRSFSESGWPWRLKENSFGRKYSYRRETLPTASDLAARSGLLMVSSNLADSDAADIVAAFKKVAAQLL
jgi:dTDP-4-amino-4,6-dideoxygalactose transaminase